jgi:hypothetical protein
LFKIVSHRDTPACSKANLNFLTPTAKYITL